MALDRLVQQGLVERQEAGRALLYRLNREHVAAPAVELLAGLRTELVQRLSKAVKGWRMAPLHASIFGSFARGEGRPDSDIDIFVICPEGIGLEDPSWREQVDLLAEQVRLWSGNHAGIVEVSQLDVERLRRERVPIVDDLYSDAIVLYGPSAATLFGAGA